MLRCNVEDDFLTSHPRWEASDQPQAHYRGGHRATLGLWLPADDVPNAHTLLRWRRQRSLATLKWWRQTAAAAASDVRAAVGNPSVVERAQVTVCQVTQANRTLRAAGCQVAVDAALDGLVDAGWLPKATSEHLPSVTFLTPLLGAEHTGLVLQLASDNGDQMVDVDEYVTVRTG